MQTKKGGFTIKIAVGGMIASGKSTLVSALGAKLKIPVMEEFDKGDEVFNTLLKWLYEGKSNVEMLLQIYFLHTHWQQQRIRFSDSKSNYVVDRDIIEHWLFAHTNLAPYPEIMNMYNGVFYAYMNSLKKPDLYLILDINWDTFKKRIMERGRASEVDNFSANESYFKDLLRNYTSLLVSQCKIFNIPYRLIDANELNTAQILDKALKIIESEGLIL